MTKIPFLCVIHADQLFCKQYQWENYIVDNFQQVDLLSCLYCNHDCSVQKQSSYRKKSATRWKAACTLVTAPPTFSTACRTTPTPLTTCAAPSISTHSARYVVRNADIDILTKCCSTLCRTCLHCRKTGGSVRKNSKQVLPESSRHLWPKLPHQKITWLVRMSKNNEPRYWLSLNPLCFPTQQMDFLLMTVEWLCPLLWIYAQFRRWSDPDHPDTFSCGHRNLSQKVCAWVSYLFVTVHGEIKFEGLCGD